MGWIVKIFWAYIIWSFFQLLRHMPRYLIPYVQKCAFKITPWTQSAAHERKWEAEMKHHDQTATYQSFFLAQFLCDSTVPQCILLLLMQWSESVFTWLHLWIWLPAQVRDPCTATHFWDCWLNVSQEGFYCKLQLGNFFSGVRMACYSGRTSVHKET